MRMMMQLTAQIEMRQGLNTVDYDGVKIPFPQDHLNNVQMNLIENGFKLIMFEKTRDSRFEYWRKRP